MKDFIKTVSISAPSCARTETDDVNWMPKVIAKDNDPVNHPSHYTEVVPGIECIQVTEHFNFCLGNAIKYIWRAGSKGNKIQDLEKAIWYVNREIENLKNANADTGSNLKCTSAR